MGQKNAILDLSHGLAQQDNKEGDAVVAQYLSKSQPVPVHIYRDNGILTRQATPYSLKWNRQRREFLDPPVGDRSSGYHVTVLDPVYKNDASILQAFQQCRLGQTPSAPPDDDQSYDQENGDWFKDVQSQSTELHVHSELESELRMTCHIGHHAFEVKFMLQQL